MAQSLSYLYSERSRLFQELAKLQQQLAYAQQTNSSRSIIDGILARIQSAEELLAVVNQQIQAGENEQRLPTSSAGQTVNDDAQARNDTSRTVSPAAQSSILTAQGRIQSPPDTTSGTNALPNNLENSVDSGTDAELIPLSESQSVSYNTVDESNGPILLSDPDIDGREVSTNVGGLPGVGSASDDAGSKNATRVEIDNVFNEEKIIPQANVLDQYASYTYNASLYLMSPEDYQQLINSKQKVLRGAQLLMQSGGAAVGGRNQYFSNDYYIDKIQLTSAITGKGTNAAHNVSSVKMTVIEPAGITLIPNLDRAVQQYLGSAEKKKNNFAAQLYLLIIRFYGYDDQGNLVRGGVPKPDGSSDPNAFVEKWYPLNIGKIDFKVSNKLVEYEIEAVSPSYQTAAGSIRGTIPYNFELSGTTVKDVLKGPASYSTTVASDNGITVDDQGVPQLPANFNTAPAKASAAPSNKTTIRSGLMTALNEHQEQLVRDGIYTYPDTYSIEFINPSIEEAKIKNKGSTDKSRVSNSTSQNAADQKVGAKQSADTNSKIATITAGSQLVQVIDQVVRNSSYLEDQQLVIYDPNSQKEIPNGAAGNNLAYFKITLQANPKPGQYDPKRNDYAYDIKYIVHVYRINQSTSNYFYVPTFKGVHKQYNYWFTGENNSVLAYEQTYHAMYSATLTGSAPGPAVAINDQVKFNWASRSAMSSQGAEGKVNEIKANLADGLFNPGDLANAQLTIVGDPAWLQQGEAFVGIKKNDPNFFRSFLADGTINFDSQQIMFEILINMPRDYDMNTGLADPNNQNSVLAVGQQPGLAKQSYVYQANKCVSEFSKGKFTQTLEGSLLTYFPDQVGKANQQATKDTQISLLNSLASFRNGSAGSLLTGLAATGLNTAFSSLTGLKTPSAGYGINLGGLLNNNILGSAATRLSNTPINPTSFGLSVGSPTLNSSNNGLFGTTVGTEQQMAIDDDASGPELLNRDD